MKDYNTVTSEQAATYRESDAVFARWAEGYGVIRHSEETQVRVHDLVRALTSRDSTGDAVTVYDLLMALDRLASAGLWLVVHQTYARNVYLAGRALDTEDFKVRPDGHTGGALNMVPAYAGYLAANVLTGHTRGWLMGQGHCVAAVDSLNLLVGNMTEAHAARYRVTDEGLTRYVRDFYSYRLSDNGRQDSPLGSHVNVHTAGGLAEGGYLGFAELQYVHMPLPGERLVAFLSDGAFEEQRGSDWTPRWWRAEDSGLVTPIMIKNGRRIDQRTTMSQQGGAEWFSRHLALNHFDPIVFDGRDPAAFLWAILEMERRLEAAAETVTSGQGRYPVLLPYGIAIAPKGAGFPGEGTNLAHNLPLMANPRIDSRAADLFNEGTRRLWVPPGDLAGAVSSFQQHHTSGRVRERDHALAHRDVPAPTIPDPPFRHVSEETRRSSKELTTASPMTAIDRMFVAILEANPGLRPRVGNPDEMLSNRLVATLGRLKFRVTDPEPAVPESVDGAVITALNEEAVVSAALANKGGINLVHTYEAFGSKMHGAVRQEVIFANHCLEAGRPQRWLSMPLILTSHTWENGKNEQSHQDPSMAESMLGEPSHVSRVLFPPDFNSAAAVMEQLYRTHGQIWTLVVPKADVIPDLLTPEEARTLVKDGGLLLDWAGYQREQARLILTAVGAYQLMEVLTASRRLAEQEIPHAVLCLLEPGRFRAARSISEQAHRASPEVIARLFPNKVPLRLFVTHTRPETILGLLGPLHTGADTAGLGYINHGGTLSTPGMLFVNRCSWAHCVQEAARLLHLSEGEVLSLDERHALDGQRSPHGVIVPETVI
ncbi:MAG: D-xylulose 5-phosphate/D-fructose 6-phosphate phosphoketolase [Thermomicrobiales bacterium]|nr:D-xylulose 5-phosphate/D-fructose 6-phosphate phosphoketolase [Thermomicrobiales bacterium]MDF3014997.1 D-xylulose 5-phosphate/D-fructose 6-phosphate phosphoketolase [Thermomicrobiales bacterium]